MTDPIALVDEYLANGGQFNPECMAHDEVRNLIVALRDTIVRERQRLAKLDAMYPCDCSAMECMCEDPVDRLIKERDAAQANALQYKTFYDGAVIRANENAMLYQNLLHRVQDLTK